MSYILYLYYIYQDGLFICSHQINLQGPSCYPSGQFQHLELFFPPGISAHSHLLMHFAVCRSGYERVPQACNGVTCISGQRTVSATAQDHGEEGEEEEEDEERVLVGRIQPCWREGALKINRII